MTFNSFILSETLPVRIQGQRPCIMETTARRRKSKQSCKV